MASEKFDVYMYFQDDTYTKEYSALEAQEAVTKAMDITRRPAAMIGIIAKVRIIDGGDFIVFEWTHEDGIVFPPEADIAAPVANSS